MEILQDDVRQVILNATRLKSETVEIMQKTPGPDKWSIAQVLEHLNIYCRHYITEIEKKLHLHQSKKSDFFYPGLLGNYFTKLMQQTGKTGVKKMKSPKSAIPAAYPAAQDMLEEFIYHQHQLLTLLQIAASANLNTIKIPTSMSRFIKLKLGDTLGFFIAHEQRHFIQIENIQLALERTKINKGTEKI